MSVTPATTSRTSTHLEADPTADLRSGDQAAAGQGRPRWLVISPWPALLLAIIPVALVLLATRDGIGISADSVAYARAGSTFRADGGFAFLDGSSFTFFPVGLPLLIAALGTGPWMVAFNLAVLVGQVVVSYRLAEVAIRSRRAALVVAAWVSVTISTVDIHAMLWSEPLFNLAANLALLQLVLVHTRRRLTPVTALTLVVSISVACSLRYVGCVLLPFAAVVVLAAMWRSGARRAVSTATVLTLFASVGLVVTVVRNLVIGVGPFGPRGGSDNSVPDVLFQVGTSIGNLVTNQAFAVGPLLCLVGWAAIAVLVVALTRSVRAHGRGVLESSAAPVVGWLGCYLVFICFSELTTSIDAIDLRISSPMQTPLFIALVLAVRQPVPARSIRRVAPVLIVGLLTITLALSASWAAVASQHGLGIERAARGHDAWLPVVEQLPARAGVITNDPFPVAWLAHRRLVAPAVDTFFFTTTSTADRVTALRGFVADSPSTYVLAVGDDPLAVTAPLQQAGLHLTSLEHGSGFTLYAVTPG